MESNARLRTGLILLALVFATGVTAALVADAMQPGPPTAPTAPPRAVPPSTTLQPPAGRQLVPAPIDKLEIRVRESYPAQYSVFIQAGLPSGCAQQGGHDVSRTGDAITVTVLNTIPTGNAVCTMIYGMYDLNVDLGSSFRAGVTYTVKVNDKTTTFVGQ